jgi:hypothetical protein
VEWLRLTMIVFVFLFSPPWGWPHHWPKHVSNYCVIKLHPYIQVHLLVFLKQFIHPINSQKMEHTQNRHIDLPCVCLKQQLLLTNSLCMYVSIGSRYSECYDPSTRFDKDKFVLSHWTTSALCVTQTRSFYTDSGWFEVLPQSLTQPSKIQQNFSPVTIITKDLKTNTMACIYGLFYNSVSRLLQTTRGDTLLTTWRHGGWAQLYCYQGWTSREWSTPRPGSFIPGTNPDTHRLEDWVSPKVCQKGCGKDKNFLSHRLLTPNLSAYIYRIRHPGHTIWL